MTDGKSACGQGRVISHPEKGPGVELLQAEQERNEQSPQQRLPPEDPTVTDHEKQADAAEAENV